MLRLAEKAFWPARMPVPGHARRHRSQLPRGPRVPGPADRGARGPAGRGLGAGVDRRRQGRRAARATLRGTGSRRGHSSTPSPRTSSTPCSGAPGATRRKPAPKRGSTRSATSSASGTRRTSDPSSGASTTGVTTPASTSGCSRCRTGPSSTSGSTSPRRSIEIPRSTSRTGGRSSGATGC